jgi:RNA polymerase-binding transcription factor DksA
MTDRHRTQLEALRAEASARIAQLTLDIDALRADRGDGNADDEHDPEGVTLSAEWSMLAGLREQEQRTLAEVEASLARIADGSAGRCVDCGQAIPAARLEARPTAVRCVACAERAGL